MKNSVIASKLNDQLDKEIFSAYLYLAIANYYSTENLDGFSNYFEVQAREELDHALLFRQYLIQNDVHVSLGKIESPNIAYTECSQGLNAALVHEEMITASIHNIYGEALACKDFQTVQFLDWFVKEQGEEEKNASDLCKKYELFAGDAKGLYLLNAELLTRVYTPASLVL